MTRSPGALSLAFTGGVAASVIVWSAFVAFRGPELPSAKAEPIAFDVTEEELSILIPVLVDAFHAPVAAIRSGSDGIITDAPGQGLVNSGDVLVLVNEVPVLVIPSSVPIFRDLRGGDTGRDVEAIELYLRSVGQLEDQSIDSVLDDKDWRAIQDVVRHHGVELGEVLPRGLFVAVPELPALFRIDTPVGQPIQRDAPFGELLELQPSLSIRASPELLDLVSVGMSVRIETMTGPFEARIVAISTDEMESADRLILEAEGGHPCSGFCDDISVNGTTRLPAQVIVLEPVVGPLVPLSAIHVNAGGSPFVILESGKRVVIKIIADARGQAIVNGLDAGQTILLDSDG